MSHRKHASGRSPEAVEYRRWYKTRRWQDLRAAQLTREPLCRMCRQMGVRRAATVVDHVRPHRGSAALFFDPANLQSLCPTHHDGTKRRLELGRRQVAVDPEGWPVEGLR